MRLFHALDLMDDRETYSMVNYMPGSWFSKSQESQGNSYIHKSPSAGYPQSTSPSTDLAMDMGTDPTKVQVMRASFFGAVDDDVDDYDSKSGIYKRIFKRKQSTDYFV